ncbi:acyl-CoA dehydrogenase [Bacillus sp. C1-1]|nr:acyl-CoA dehydrogenase [Bacillus sp. C1-1]
MDLLNTTSAVERERRLLKLIKPFHKIGAQHDRTQTVPIENIQVLRDSGYAALAVEKEFGGLEVPLSEWLRLQELIAREDGPTALSIGWHMGTMYQEAQEKSWPKSHRLHVLKAVVNKGMLLNTAATEKATGSPTRGGVFQTSAKKTTEGWMINGEKTFYTLAEHLDYYLVLATIEEDGTTGLFLIEKGTEGVRVNPTWDMMAMGSTGSHDLVLDRVKVREDALLKVQMRQELPQAWLLHIPACYLGIGYAAIQEAATYARTYAPNSIGKPIATIPTVRQRLGEAMLLYQQSQSILYGVSKQWDEASKDERKTMRLPFMMTKKSVVQHAINMVDLSMKVVGAQSLAHASPLSRYYRNVRAGLHNPPMDDQTIEFAAKTLLNE